MDSRYPLRRYGRAGSVAFGQLRCCRLLSPCCCGSNANRCFVVRPKPGSSQIRSPKRTRPSCSVAVSMCVRSLLPNCIEKGWLKRCWSPTSRDDRAAAIGAVSGHTEANRRVLLSLGVPAADIENFGSDNKTPGMKRWLFAMGRRHAAKTLIVPTEIFTARRVRWMFRQEFQGRGCADHCSIIRAAAIHHGAVVEKGERRSSPSRTRSSNIFIIG